VPNRLAETTSIYLRQHAENPVDWQPWGPEAFEKARREDKPVIVSIGYASCHWCHVMEHESFSDPAVAAMQNEHFVSIKVDREERPDVDRVYMAACQLLTRSGGWPLNAFVLPDGRPFYAGTYFPPAPRFGRPSWRQVLEALHRAWTSKRDEILSSAEQITGMIRREEELDGAAREPGPEDVSRATRELLSRADPEHGGFGHAPKFPNVLYLEHLLRVSESEGRPEAGAHVALTLDRLIAGGIHDQLRGGFHRYSVDERWAVPHFEKMLYDNGLLLRAWAEAIRLERRRPWADAVTGIAEWLAAEMTAEDGSFYTAQDADSEGEEGRFFVWDPGQLTEVLGERDGRFAAALYGVTPSGNFEHGMTVLSRSSSELEAAARAGIDAAEAAATAASVRERLLAARSRRPWPLRDDKRLRGWNGLAIQGLARAGWVLGDARLVAMASRAAEAVLDGFRLPGGALARVRQRVEGRDLAHTPAFLDDHAYLALALIDLFAATGDVRWLRGALPLCDEIVARFVDPGTGGLALAPHDGERLCVQPRSAMDEAVPSAVGAALLALQRMGELVDRPEWTDLIVAALSRHGAEVAMSASGCATLLRVVSNGWRGLVTVVGVAARGTPERDVARARERLGEVVGADDLVVLLREGEVLESPLRSDLAEARGPGKPWQWFVCAGRACAAPVGSLGEVAEVRARLLRGGA
jgi:uncharacterized protein YyaL (SSP411 family)